MANRTPPEPFYSSDDRQMQARPVDDDILLAWQVIAATYTSRMLPGDMNWPMMVRSLIAEITRLRVEAQVVVR